MKKIMLVEDDAFIRDIVSMKLKSADYEVVVASSSDEAFSKLEAFTPDIFLLDIDLPGNKSGLDILTDLRKTDAYIKTPVIIFSNNDAPEVREQAAKCGAQDFYFKASTGPDELLSKIESLLV